MGRSAFFLVWCGSRAVDKYSSQSYEHRRGWVEERLSFLSTVFAIDICAYAVMNNHTHVVLCVNKALADNWDSDTLSQGELITFDKTVETVLKSAYNDRSLLVSCYLLIGYI